MVLSPQCACKKIRAEKAHSLTLIARPSKHSLLIMTCVACQSSMDMYSGAKRWLSLRQLLCGQISESVGLLDQVAHCIYLRDYMYACVAIMPDY